MTRESFEGTVGVIDVIDGRLVQGWAVSRHRLDSNGIVDVFVDAVFVTRICADQFRADLMAEGYRNGYAGFAFEIPDRYCDGQTHIIDMRHAGTDRSLANSPQPFVAASAWRTKLVERRRWCDEDVVFESRIDDRFTRGLEAGGKLAIFSTYHERASHFAYHRMILKSLARAGFTVLIVHAAGEYRPGVFAVDIPGCFTIHKRNVGYDFGSHAVGVFAAYEQLHLVDELIVMNDSVLQIADELVPLIERFRARKADVVSCTDSFEHDYHLQSYMLWFGTELCRSDFLPRFMTDYDFRAHKQGAIAEGEIRLSRALLAEGFHIDALFSYEAVASAWIRQYDATARRIRDLPGACVPGTATSFKEALLVELDRIVAHVLSGHPMNPSHYFWDTLVERFEYPFIKRELIITNPVNVPTYFKLGDHLAPGSEAHGSALEVRRLFGGQLVPISVPACRAAADETWPSAAGTPREGSALAPKFVELSEIDGPI